MTFKENIYCANLITFDQRNKVPCLEVYLKGDENILVNDFIDYFNKIISNNNSQSCIDNLLITKKAEVFQHISRYYLGTSSNDLFFIYANKKSGGILKQKIPSSSTQVHIWRNLGYKNLIEGYCSKLNE